MLTDEEENEDDKDAPRRDVVVVVVIIIIAIIDDAVVIVFFFCETTRRARISLSGEFSLSLYAYGLEMKFFRISCQFPLKKRALKETTHTRLIEE